MKENIILELTFNFSLKIISLYKILSEQKEFVLSKQVLRSAASIGANVEEANAAQTKKDFIAKDVNSIKGSKGNKILASSFRQKPNSKNRLHNLFISYRTNHQNIDKNCKNFSRKHSLMRIHSTFII